MIRPVRACLIALVALALPAGLAAQQAPAAPTVAEQQEMQTLLTEMQQLQAKLQPVQARALEDPTLQASQEALGAQIKAAVEQADPGVTQTVDQLQQLETEAATAQAAGDQAKLQQLAGQAQQLQMRFMAAQQKAFEQPEIASRLQTFQTNLEGKMIELEPQAAGWIQRFKEIGTTLEGKMQGAPGGPGR